MEGCAQGHFLSRRNPDNAPLQGDIVVTADFGRQTLSDLCVLTLIFRCPNLYLARNKFVHSQMTFYRIGGAVCLLHIFVLLRVSVTCLAIVRQECRTSYKFLLNAQIHAVRGMTPSGKTNEVKSRDVYSVPYPAIRAIFLGISVLSMRPLKFSAPAPMANTGT